MLFPLERLPFIHHRRFTLKPSELIEDILLALDAQLPVHIWGPSGVGKSDIVRAIAKALGLEFLDIRAVLLDPVDLRGLPTVDGDVTRWLPPNFLPKPGTRGILFLDELTTAPQMVQAACYQLVLDRCIGESYKLPDGWAIIAAGNPASERGVHFAMPRPLRNRFKHMELEVDLIEWCQWAGTNQIEPEVIAFLRLRPELLFSPGTDMNVNAWPSPRSNAMMSRYFTSWKKRHGSNLDARLQRYLAGIVGDGAAGEFYAFLQMFRNLPSTDEILRDPYGTRVPDASAPSESIMIATALGRVINDRNISTAAVYLERMADSEYLVLAMRDAKVRDPLIAKTQTFTTFGIKHQQLVA
jgi:hypothetical protein